MMSHETPIQKSFLEVSGAGKTFNRWGERIHRKNQQPRG